MEAESGASEGSRVITLLAWQAPSMCLLRGSFSLPGHSSTAPSGQVLTVTLCGMQGSDDDDGKQHAGDESTGGQSAGCGESCRREIKAHHFLEELWPKIAGQKKAKLKAPLVLQVCASWSAAPKSW